MALLEYDNMGDTYDASTFTQRGWSGTINSIVAGRVAGNAIRLMGGTIITPDVITKNVTLGTEFTRHIAVYLEANTGSDFVIMEFFEGAVTHVQVCLVSGTRMVRIKRNGTTVVTGTHAVPIATWCQLNVHIKVGDAAAGACHVSVDGVADISDTAGDYKNGGTGAIDTYKLYGSSGQAVRYDDLHTWSGNDDKGNSRVLGRLPTADGNYHAWGVLTGTDHYAMVDDSAPDGDTTYNYSGTTGQRDSFVMGASGLPSTATILAVGVTAVARKLDVGARLLNLFLRVAGSDYHDAVDQNPAFSYSGLQAFWATNPAGGAWTVAAADAAEAGVRDHT
jgi:hypothetical protein